MRMICANDVLSALAGQPDGRQVVVRVDKVTPRGVVGDVARPDGGVNPRVIADQQAAAFLRRRLAGVFDDGGGDAIRQCHTSITIAMPMPPPMHREATPRPPPRLRSA